MMTTATKTRSERATRTPPASAEASGMLHIRVADTLKQQAAETLEGIGLTTSEAVRLFLHRVVVEQRLPLDLKVPNADTQAAMIEARALAAGAGKSGTPQEMFDALEKAG